MVLVLLIRALLVAENKRRDEEPQVDEDEDVFVEIDGEKVKVDKVRRCAFCMGCIGID